MKIKFSKDLYSAIVLPIKNAWKAATNQSVMQQFAEEIAKDIELRTRLGKVADKTGGKEKKMAPLKPRTIRQREYMDKNGTLATGQGTEARVSNLTATGKMLSSIKGESSNDRKFRIFIDDSKRAKIATYHQNGTPKMAARPFMTLSGIQIKRIKRKMKQLILKMVDVFSK